jgi:hypothetical protein
LDPDKDLDLDDVLDDDADDGDGDDSGDDQGPADEQADDKKDKRINDLMSKWQSEEAARKKAEAELARLTKGAPKGASGAKEDVPPAVQQWIEVAKGQARDQIYASDPRFGELGLDRELISGSTPEEMRDSAKKLGGLLDTISTRIRADVLKKHGLSPEVKGTPAPKNKSVEQMSDEEFEKFYQRQKAEF